MYIASAPGSTVEEYLCVISLIAAKLEMYVSSGVVNPIRLANRELTAEDRPLNDERQMHQREISEYEEEGGECCSV